MNAELSSLGFLVIQHLGAQSSNRCKQIRPIGIFKMLYKSAFCINLGILQTKAF